MHLSQCRWKARPGASTIRLPSMRHILQYLLSSHNIIHPILRTRPTARLLNIKVLLRCIHPGLPPRPQPAQIFRLLQLVSPCRATLLHRRLILFASSHLALRYHLRQVPLARVCLALRHRPQQIPLASSCLATLLRPQPISLVRSCLALLPNPRLIPLDSLCPTLLASFSGPRRVMSLPLEHFLTMITCRVL